MTSECKSLAIFKIGKGWKRLQTSNLEIELLQQYLNDDLQEIVYRLQKNKIRKVAKLRSRYNELYHEFVSFTTQCITTLEERLTSLNQWVDFIFKIQYENDKLIESLQQ